MDIYEAKFKKIEEGLEYNSTKTKEQHKVRFELLASYLDLSYEIGNLISEKIAQKEIEFLNYSILKLHEYALDLLQQIYILLKNGSASGGLARWRSLFECAVVMLFLKKCPETSNKYYAHSKIDEYKFHLNIKELAGEKKFFAVNKDYFEHLEKDYKDLIEKFGKNFGKEYGWAKTKEKTYTNLADLSKAVDKYDLYLISREASYYNHASSFNTMYKRGAKENSKDKLSYMLSPFGMETPFLVLSTSTFDINDVCLEVFLNKGLTEDEVLVYKSLNCDFLEKFTSIDSLDR